MLTDADIMAQVFAAFQDEQAEHRQAAADLLLQLERGAAAGQRRELLDQLFREAHSLKGSARAAGQPEIAQLAHRVEDVFSAVRQGRLELTPVVCDPIYTALDAIGALTALAVAGQLVDLQPYQALLDQLDGLLRAGSGAPAPAAPAVECAAPAAPAPQPALGDEAATVRLPTAVLDGLLNEAGELLACAIRARQQAGETQELAALPARWRRVWRRVHPALSRVGSAAAGLRPTIHHLDDRPTAGADLASTRGIEHGGDIATLLDALAQANALIGELESRLSASAARARSDHARLAAVTDRLHDQVRRTRMLPLTALFNPLRVQVREMARAAGKQIELGLDDGGAEADRQVLDRLRDVVIQLLRNAVDHGIEPAAARAAAGKPATGQITLSATVGGDRLRLTLCDDGAGLDLEAVRRQAIEGGVLSEADLEHLSEAEVADLIFLPGLSTKTIVSELSGRGVGLDIVRANVERMHGRVSVASQPGQGCSFTISVPLSLTSAHGLLLRAGADRYILPIDAIQRIVSVTPREVHLLEGRATLLLDGRPAPLVSLSELLGGAPPPASGATYSALLLGGERPVACLIDAVLGEQELVVHRLPAPLRRARFVAGAAILADGAVVPVLDAVDVYRAALGTQRSLMIGTHPTAAQRTPTVMVADDSITTRTLEKNILEAAGYRVLLATDGREALDTLRGMSDTSSCDLLLSDVDMPRLNGFDLTVQLRTDERYAHLPVVLVTSLDDQADRERGIAAGADAYIVKRSFDQHALLDTIARLI